MKALSPEQLEFFNREGYLMVPDVFVPADLMPLREELTGVIDREARRLVEEGRLSQSFEEEPFERRLTKIWNECPGIMQPLTGKGGGGYSGAELFRLITHSKLVAYIESFVGEEIIGSSVYRIRPKIPGMDQGVVPWHQDSGYFEPHCDDDLIVTVWMPLVDATPENGCLQVFPRAHDQGILRHWTNGPNGYLAIADDDLPPTGDPVTVPVPMGGALFLSNRTPHCSTPNTSDIVRWSLDLRYQSAEVPNNVGEMPETFHRERPIHEIACYPPEADFVVQSACAPERVVATPAAFDQIRQRYEDTRPQSPQRGWGNYEERSA
jgi:phytanoyl-CoA hydroxylase